MSRLVSKLRQADAEAGRKLLQALEEADDGDVLRDNRHAAASQLRISGRAREATRGDP